MDRYHDALVDIFRRASCKHEAHRRARPILQDMAADRGFFTTVLREYLATERALNAPNYPVVAMDWRLNEWFGLVVNCWIPLPSRRTEVSTKAIHHHGNMLLSTVTLFGAGYEHWTFTRPELVDEAAELYRMRTLDRAPHPVGHVSFVDAHIPHLPWYPPELSITCCLWSNQFPTTWRDRLKRVDLLKRNERLIRQVARSAGLDRVLARTFDVKIIEYFDYYPVAQGFRGMRERQEYEVGPNQDHLASLFHVVQRTHNEDVAPLVEQRLRQGGVKQPAVVERLLSELRAGRPIEGQLSSCHLDVPHTTFTQDAVDRAIAAVTARPVQAKRAVAG